MQKLARNTLLRSVFDLASQYGVSRSDILSAIELDAELALQPGAFIPSEKLIDAIEFAAVASGRRDFGLRLGAQNDHRSLGPVGVLAEHCQTVAQAVAEGSRYLHLHNSALLYTLEPVRGLYVFRAQVHARGRFEPKQYVECLITMFVRFCRLVIDKHWRPQRILFEHEKIAERTAYQQAFGCEMRFGEEQTAVLTPIADFERPIEKSDPRIRNLVKQLLDDVEREQAEDTRAKVAVLVRPLLVKGEATATKVAALMSLPPRTLQRRLAEQGTSFREILIEIRLQLIDDFLTRRDVSVTDMVPVLGFSEVSAVSRFLRLHKNQSAKAIKMAGNRLPGKRTASARRA